MFQKLCKAERDWDELVDTELNQQWLSSLSNLRQAGRVSFNRCYAKGLNGSEVKSVQLHCFADASEKAYGAAVYMRVEYESKVECQLVASKTRVAPLAKQSIPRLELLANLTASRLLKSVRQALDDVVRVDDKFNWTDSMISLWWIINTDKEYKQFVENRVSEIRRNAPSAQWKYCPTKENPADIASRGITATELKESSLWLHGPKFLSKNSEHWPVQPAKIQAREELCELKSAKSVVSSLVNMTKGEETEEKANLENIIKPENFSSVHELTRREKYLTTVLSQFWKRWQKEYLTEVRVHHDCNLKNKQPKINVGDVVCIHKDKTPRQLWNMGVIKSLITGRDGFHRGAVVRTRSGDRVIEVTRPLRRLYPVEVGSQLQKQCNRNTDFPITFVENAEQERISEH